MTPGGAGEQVAASSEWGAIVERALAGDRVAYGRLTRLVTGYLARWRAYDFRADWEDIVQEVLVSTVEAHREGRFASDAAFQAWVRQATRFKFVDRIRAKQRRGEREFDERVEPESGAGGIPWPPEKPLQDAAVELRVSLERALERLDPRERAAIVEVHLKGRTYPEASEATGIPLGSLKRALKTGLIRLRKGLDERPGS